MTTVLELEQPIAARPWWRQRWQLILGGFALAAAVGVVFAIWIRSQTDWSHGLAWERAFIVATHGPLPGAIDSLMLVFPWFGTNISLIPAVGAIVWWLWVKRRRPDLAIRLGVVQLGSYLLNPSLKALFDRARPDIYPRRGWFGWTSYPSGHAIASVSVLLTLAIVLHRECGWRWPYAAVALVILASSFSRVYLGVHWPTDVIGGALVGAAWLGATSYAFRDGETNARPPAA